MHMIEQAKLAKQASATLRNTSADVRNGVLLEFARNMVLHQNDIIDANRKDMEESANNGMSEAMLDRLMLDEKRIQGMAEGILQIVQLEDPLYKVLEEKDLSSGVHLKKVSCAIGVIGIIFESRPNVTADCAALCFKAGSACVLKGGKESYRSCLSIVTLFREALKKFNLDTDLIQLADRPDHAETQQFMECREYVDLLIPRGSKRLIEAVVQNAKVPVIETGAGVCHTFVDASADPDMAINIVLNAKCSRPSVCNAMETLLIHEVHKETLLPLMVQKLAEAGVTIHGDEEACKSCPSLLKADENSWHTEYNRLEMNLKIVKDVSEAIQHIQTYGTKHSECIITENQENADLFMQNIDAACIYHNASTRFTDGFEFGLGAEIGISTQKLHARGPMGLKELTTYTYLLSGKGEIR